MRRRGLADAWGETFERLYERYERDGKARGRVRAQDLWFKILEATNGDRACPICSTKTM